MSAGVEASAVPVKGWTAHRMRGGSRTLSHGWIAVAPECPLERHPTRDCGCTVFRTPDEAAAFIAAQNATQQQEES